MMRIVFEIDHLSELEEIKEWLSRRRIIVQQKVTDKIDAEAFFNRLKKFKVELPSDYQFNRDEANER